MRTIRSLLSPLAAAALTTAAVSPVAAQRATAADYARPVVRNGAVAPEVSVRTLAVYQFQAPREAGMPTQVTVADSAGQLVASYDLAGARAARPMAIEVRNNDLVLRAQTPSGLVTFVLYEQNDPDARGEIAGRWSLGGQTGELRAAR
jgi:hypothetical protein